MPVEVVDPKGKGEEAHMVVCIRVEDMPIPALKSAYQDNCQRCGARIWVAPSSPTTPKRVCLPCVKVLVAEDGEEPLVLVSENAAVVMEALDEPLENAITKVWDGPPTKN